MGLVLIGGYYDKTKALDILNNLKYYKQNLEPIESDEDLIKAIGIIPFIMLQENKMHEDFLVDKLKRVRSILEKQGNDAIDAYEELISPNENHPIYPLKKMLKLCGNESFSDIIDDMSTEMKKEEFEHYLDIYNLFTDQAKSK